MGRSGIRPAAIPATHPLRTRKKRIRLLQRIFTMALAMLLVCPASAFATVDANGADLPAESAPSQEPGAPGSLEVGADGADGGAADGDPGADNALDEDHSQAEAPSDVDADGSEEATDEELTDEDGIAPQSIDLNDPANAAILASHVVEGLDPPNTTINLFDYDTGRRGGEAIDGVANVPGSNSITAGTDTLGFTGSRSAADNYRVWLDDPDGINYGRLLTFGDGMRHMGYWNQGLVKAYGSFANRNPGMQNIVMPTLVDGFPCLSDAVNPSSYPSWLQTGDYDAHTQLYADARRDNGALIYDVAGDKNISNGVQYLAVDPGDVAGAPANAASGGGQDLSVDARSLSYLFDPDEHAAGKVASHTDVNGLFQIDDKGYYYYNMRDNYAWYDESSNSFVLYDQPAGLRTDAPAGSTDARLTTGNFFPFNSPADAFSITADGQLVNALNANNDKTQNSAPVNHHLGLTMQTDFRQPVNGTVGSDPMTFEFIGDDDLWVFIDDVLVLDIGGIHSELFGTIDFSTGEVRVGTAFDSGGSPTINDDNIVTSIKEMFEVAGVDTSTGFTGNTFASNTSHTLKMFYLERGNYDSSLAMRFNLQPELFQQIKKVDQDGEPVSGAAFDLYAVDATSASDAASAALDDVTEGALLTSLVTDSDGLARFMDGSNPFNFADRVTDEVSSQLYILKETSAPAGYRMMPAPLLLRYDRETGTFIVNNRYDTGSYASFNSYVNQISNESLTFGAYDPDTGHIAATDAHVPLDQQGGGLVVAVPTIKQSAAAQDRWEPLYGSNNQKLETIVYDPADVHAMRNAMLQAVLHQAYLSSEDDAVPGWYLTWNAAERRMRSYHTEHGPDGDRVVCTLSDLPGTPSRYILNNPDGDMQMVYGILSKEVFGADGANMTSAQKYAHLAELVKAQLVGSDDPSPEQVQAAVSSVAATIDAQATSGAGGDHATRGFNAIDTSDGAQFERNFRTVINMPNEQRELRVWKVDQHGNRVNGAVFALFESASDAASAADAEVNGQDVVTRVTAANGSVLHPVAAGVTGDLTGAQTKYQGDDLEGMLVFAPYVDDGPGGAYTTWNQGDDSNNGKVLYLKEVKAPIGFEPNDTVITVVIGQYGIYADAGNEFDGVDVLAGVGKLATTMSKYAASPNVNLTLRYIVSTCQSQRSGVVPSGATSIPFEDFNRGWTSDASKQMDLTYGKNAIIDYGSEHPFTEEQLAAGIGYVDAKGRERPLFCATSGFVRTQVTQDTDAMLAAQAGEYPGVNGDALRGQDLTNLFMIRNTVKVTDTRHAAPQIKKVDQDGDPVTGAVFELYPVDAPAGMDEAALAEATLADVQGGIASAPLARLVTDGTGTAEFSELGADGQPTGSLVDFPVRAVDKGLAGGRLYVLREAQAPPGYRALLTDLLLRFEPTTSMLIVNDRYDTGASGSFASFVAVDSDIHYGSYADGSVSPQADIVSSQVQQEGLIMAVPLVKSDDSWLPLHGDVTDGYTASSGTDERAVFEAALLQAASGKSPWHLDWNDSISALLGYLEGLPGTADRYRLKNPDGDMQMVYFCISPEALDKVGVGGIGESARRYQALGAACASDVSSALAQMMAVPGGVRIIDSSDLDRNFQALVYIPNGVRQLRLWKVDQEGGRLDGAVFALFEDAADAKRACSATVDGGAVTRIQDASGSPVAAFASGVTGVSGADDPVGSQHGSLVFAPDVDDGPGSAHTMWIDPDGKDLVGRILYLKEVQAPDHYLANETVIPVVIGRYGIYVDAGSAKDGVDVLAGAGALAAPLRKLASSPEVNLTLRYLLSAAQVQDSLALDGSDDRIDGGSVDFDAFDQAWRFSYLAGDDAAQKLMHLVYGRSNALVDYGTEQPFTEEELMDGVGYVDAQGVERPLFTTSEGFIRTRLEQDGDALRAAQASGPYAGVQADELGDNDLTPLFMIENTVRVIDLPDPDDPPGPGPGPGTDPDGPGNPGQPSGTPQGTSFPDTGDRMGGALLALAVLIALAGAALIVDRTMMRAMQQNALFTGRPSAGAHVRKGKRTDRPHFRR